MEEVYFITIDHENALSLLAFGGIFPNNPFLVLSSLELGQGVGRQLGRVFVVSDLSVVVVVLSSDLLGSVIELFYKLVGVNKKKSCISYSIVFERT